MHLWLTFVKVGSGFSSDFKTAKLYSANVTNVLVLDPYD